MPPITLAQGAEGEDANEVLAFGIRMPFFEGLKMLFGQRHGVVHAHIGPVLLFRFD